MFSSSVRVFVCDQLPGHNSNGPNAPGRFIMWYRNETAILALWHRPHPAGIYSHYQVFGADVVIQFPPERFPDKDGFYRLDYWPPQGAPPPNTTFTPAKVVEGIELTRVLPGTKYDFQLYYCNDTLSHLPRWTASIAIGRAYNTSVETVSQNQISLPTAAQFRTIPLGPTNITFDPKSVTPHSFVVRWDAPVAITTITRQRPFGN
ncbi:tyrosine-protein phosphatase 10D-like isoform X2 [Palaemon carinicauda]|uniref:tyrosine-protein phosphatase 10D-like isoform X2 n=1 Tax=Palaemon carinicauda TaxID=392227 RepID=UPI0035B5C84F